MAILISDKIDFKTEIIADTENFYNDKRQYSQKI
jgi:hypothetical protein